MYHSPNVSPSCGLRALCATVPFELNVRQVNAITDEQIQNRLIPRKIEEVAVPKTDENPL
jgi:hypothetical protein